MLFIQRTLTATALLAGFLHDFLSLGQPEKGKTDSSSEEAKLYEAIGMMFLWFRPGQDAVHGQTSRPDFGRHEKRNHIG